MVIDSAHGDHFDAYFSDPSSSTASTSVSKDTNMLNSYFDGSASWFT
jgi:dethiobiotin synthetase/adenosylmethionine--8-amino-7-oxononanoate aminotransferase